MTSAEREEKAIDPDGDALLFHLAALGDTKRAPENNTQARKRRKGLSEIEILLHGDEKDRQVFRYKLGAWKFVQRHALPIMLAERDNTQTVMRIIKLLARMTTPLPRTLPDYNERILHLQQAKAAMVDSDCFQAAMILIQDPLDKHPFDRTEQDNDVLELLLALFVNVLKIPNPTTSLGFGVAPDLHDRCLLKMHQEGVLEVLVVLAHTLKEEEITVEIDQDVEVEVDDYETTAAPPPLPPSSQDGIGDRIGDQNDSELGKQQPQNPASQVEPSADSTNSQIEAAGTRVPTEPIPTQTFPGKKKIMITKKILKKKKFVPRVQLAYLIMEALVYIYLQDSAENLLAVDLTAESKSKARGEAAPVDPEKERLRASLLKQNHDLADLKSRMARQLPSRHSKFGSLYSVTDPLREGKKELVKTVFQTQSLLPEDLFAEVASRKPVPNSAIRETMEDDVRRVLVNTTAQFIELGYNNLMALLLKSMYPEVIAGGGTQADIGNFLNLASFVMAFHRLTTKRAIRAAEKLKATDPNAAQVAFNGGSLLATVNKDVWRFLIFRIKYCLDTKPPEWTSLGPCAAFLKELVRNVYEMMCYGDDTSKAAADAFRRSALADEESLELICKLVKLYAPYRNNKQYLGDLVLASHFVMRILSSHGAVAMKKKLKPRTRKPKKKVVKMRRKQNPQQLSSDQASSIIGEPSQSEAANEESILAGIDAGEEFEYYEEDEGDEEEGETEEEIAARVKRVRDQELFDLNKMIITFAHPQVLRSYCLLLNHYSTNTREVNDAIVKLFERLAFDRKMQPLFFQLSVFCLLDKILQDESIHHDPAFQALRTFAKQIVRDFFTKAATQPLLFVELLFWKSTVMADMINNPDPENFARLGNKFIRLGEKLKRDAQKHDHEDGEVELAIEGPATVGPLTGEHSKGKRWTEDENKLLAQEYETYKAMPDVLEVLVPIFGRSRETIKAHLKKLGLWVATENPTSVKKRVSKKPKPDGEEGEEGMLKKRRRRKPQPSSDAEEENAPGEEGEQEQEPQGEEEEIPGPEPTEERGEQAEEPDARDQRNIREIQNERRQSALESMRKRRQSHVDANPHANNSNPSATPVTSKRRTLRRMAVSDDELQEEQREQAEEEVVLEEKVDSPNEKKFVKRIKDDEDSDAEKDVKKQEEYPDPSQTQVEATVEETVVETIEESVVETLVDDDEEDIIAKQKLSESQSANKGRKIKRVIASDDEE